MHYYPSKELVLACDTSPYGVGAILLHKVGNGLEKPIAFTSHSLALTERKYSHLGKEGLSIIFGIRTVYCHSYVGISMDPEMGFDIGSIVLHNTVQIWHGTCQC